VFYGALALGWRGSASQWHRHGAVYRIMAALAVPLVVSVHSIVGLDFAASMMPGWQESIFPPFFVVGALYSGFATVLLLAVLVRWGLGFQTLVTHAHLDAMAKILLAASILMTYCYATEWFMAWYGSGRAERTVVGFAFTGDFAPFYRALLLCNCVLPQALWFRRARRSLLVLVGLCLLIDVGMWLERVTLILDTLARDFLPSMWWGFHPTLWDWVLLLSPLGFFAFMFLLFVRLVPAVSIHEVRQLVVPGGQVS
jgi:molybdopterin-containing oxidoreductase family membrane subunit